MPKQSIYDAASDKVLEYLLATPAALATVVFAFISGHMWTYIVFTYFQDKKKAKGHFDGWIGKVALGLFWFAIVCAPVYWCLHRSFSIKYGNVLECVVPTILYGMVLQGLVFAALAILKKE